MNDRLINAELKYVSNITEKKENHSKRPYTGLFFRR